MIDKFKSMNIGKVYQIYETLISIKFQFITSHIYMLYQILPNQRKNSSTKFSRNN